MLFTFAKIPRLLSSRQQLSLDHRRNALGRTRHGRILVGRQSLVHRAGDHRPALARQDARPAQRLPAVCGEGSGVAGG